MPAKSARDFRVIIGLLLLGLVLPTLASPGLAGDNDKNRDLIIASMKGNLAEVSRLLDSGADPSAKDQKDWTALTWARSGGHWDVVRILERGSEGSAKAKATLDEKLIQATKDGDLALIKTLLDKGADINAKDKGGWTALMDAARSGHLEVVKLLLEKGPDIYAMASAMAVAKAHGHKEIEDLLKAYGAQTREALRIGRFADKVARRGDELLFRLKDGKVVSVKDSPPPRPDEPDSPGDFAGDAKIRYTFDGLIDLWYVIDESYYESYGTQFINWDTGAVKSVYGSSLFSPDKTRFLAVGSLTEAPCDVEMWRLSREDIVREWVLGDLCSRSYQWSGPSTVEVDDGDEVIARVKHGGTSWSCSGSQNICQRMEDSPTSDDRYSAEMTADPPTLMEAAERGDLQAMKLLIDKGADLNEGYGGMSAVMHAVKAGRLEAAELLMDRGAHFDAAGDFGQAILVKSAKAGHLAMVKLLLDKGANVSTKDCGGWTALMAAAGEGHLDVVGFLVDNGAEVNAKDKPGRTALVSAAIRGHSKVIKLLLDKGAEVNVKDKEGWTALMDAAWSGNAETVSLLLAKSADVNASTERGETALMTAAVSGHVGIVKLLLAAGADINAKPKFGQTALKIAHEKGHQEIEELLRARGAKE